jgi:hypothetical protein
MLLSYILVKYSPKLGVCARACLCMRVCMCARASAYLFCVTVLIWFKSSAIFAGVLIAEFVFGLLFSRLLAVVRNGLIYIVFSDILNYYLFICRFSF